MSTTTIEMLVVRVETLEKQLALLLKDANVPLEVVKDKKEKKTTKKSKDDASKDDASDDEVDVVKTNKKEKKEKKESSSDDEVKKKRGPNGYILFSNANRDDVKAKLFVGDEKPKNTEVMKQLAALWQTTSAEEKAEWNAKAKVSDATDVA